MKGYLFCKAGFEAAACEEAYALFAPYLQTARPHPGAGWASLFVDPGRVEAFSSRMSLAFQRKLNAASRAQDLSKGGEHGEHSITPGPVFIWDLVIGEPLAFRSDERDRLGPVVDAIVRGLRPGSQVAARVLVPDGEKVPGLTRFSGMFARLLDKNLPAPVEQVRSSGHPLEAVVAFCSYEEAIVMVRNQAVSAHASRRGRVQRRSAHASRSASKLSEAWRFFGIAEPQRAARAVDLGAAPGGWTAVLLEHMYDVIAVDNGALQNELLASPHVTHLRHDAFSYRPPGQVDMLVCDVVDQPQKTVHLVQKWMERQWACRFVFNLKLPMKKHYPAVCGVLEPLQAYLEQNWAEYRLDAHQLFHDRQEVTVFAELIRRKPGRQK